MPRRMKPSSLCTLAAIAVFLSAAACQKQSESRRGELNSMAGASADPQKPRLDASKVVLTWDQGKMTYGDLHKKKEAQYKKLYNKYMNEMYSMEEQELESYIIQ